MAYRVEVSKNAETELEELYLWVVDRAPQQGAKWFNGLERAILALDQHPERCPVAPESFDPDHPVRVLSYGRQPHVYRIFFTVDHAANVVGVVHVRRGARQRPTVDGRRTEGRVDRGTPLLHRARIGAAAPARAPGSRTRSEGHGRVEFDRSRQAPPPSKVLTMQIQMGL